MIHTQPPFGMDKEVSQVQTNEPYFKFRESHSITDPFGRPGCYKQTERLCGKCPWKSDCKNAEGRN